jgi:hypothetical protein
MKIKVPTLQVYQELQQAYAHFNERLFSAQLPRSLITLQRKKTSLGYFSYQRFINVAGQRTDP